MHPVLYSWAGSLPVSCRLFFVFFRVVSPPSLSTMSVRGHKTLGLPLCTHRAVHHCYSISDDLRAHDARRCRCRRRRLWWTGTAGASVAPPTASPPRVGRRLVVLVTLGSACALLLFGNSIDLRLDTAGEVVMLWGSVGIGIRARGVVKLATGGESAVPHPSSRCRRSK